MAIKLPPKQSDRWVGLTEIHNYWLIQLANRILVRSGRGQEEPGMIMQVVGKPPKENLEASNNCPHNIILLTMHWHKIKLYGHACVPSLVRSSCVHVCVCVGHTISYCTVDFNAHAPCLFCL